MTEQDEIFMKRAISLATEGVDANAGGPFGCVIVKDNKIVGEGYNKVTSTNDPTAHAEVTAIRDACKNLGTFQLDLALENQIDNHNFVGKAGIKYVWAIGDIQATKIAWLNKTISTRHALKMVFKAFIASCRSELDMVFSIKDPKPGLMALKNQFPNLRKLPKTLKARR